MKFVKVFSLESFLLYGKMSTNQQDLIATTYALVSFAKYSGTLLNGHLSTADTHYIVDNSESPDCSSIHFNT